MKNLKVNIPEGYKIDENKSTFENIVFKKVDTEKDKEELFLKLFQGLTMKSDIEEYPGSVFYFRDDKCMLKIEDDALRIYKDGIWDVFEDRFDMDYSEIRLFIKKMVGKHFNWKGLMPKHFSFFYQFILEAHFNNKQ